MYCSGGDADSFACVDNVDCPDGECVGAVPTPTTGATNTPRPPTPTPAITNTRTATPVVTATTATTPATVAPTATGTRGTAVPTSTRTITQTPQNTIVIPTNTPRATDTPTEGEFATTTTDVAAGGHAVVLDLPADEVVAFPVEGVVLIDGQSFPFTRRRTSKVLNLTTPEGLPFAVSAGSTVLVIDATPGPPRSGGIIYRNEQGGSGCVIQSGSTPPASLIPLLLGIVLAVGARGLRRFD
jgi:hypothetical protein